MPKFLIAEHQVSYPDALLFMESTIKTIREGGEELIWFLEHPPLYTAGTSANPADFFGSSFPIYPSQRGGKHTYHGPGQLVVYIMVDLKKRGNDVRVFVRSLENWIIETLSFFYLDGVRKSGRVGVWLDDNRGERKIAAIGVRVTHGVTWHGLSLNVSPNLDHYKNIIPCGLKEYRVTSLKEEGHSTQIPDLIDIMKKLAVKFFKFEHVSPPLSMHIS